MWCRITCNNSDGTEPPHDPKNPCYSLDRQLVHTDSSCPEFKGLKFQDTDTD